MSNLRTTVTRHAAQETTPPKINRGKAINKSKTKILKDVIRNEENSGWPKSMFARPSRYR